MFDRNEYMRKYSQEYFKKYPWRKVLYAVHQRCNDRNAVNYADYGGKGVRCLLTEEQIERLWFRDKAYLLKRASIDRLDSSGHYTYSNCQFIEHVENCIKDKRIPVLQFSLDGQFIREWDSLWAVERAMHIQRTSIKKVCEGKFKQTQGFKWRFKDGKY